MGSCGSSLDCGKCYSSVPREGCASEITVNSDIAGIGVLVSFYFSAVTVFVIVLWAYFQELLPDSLLNSLDRTTLHFIKSCGRDFLAFLRTHITKCIPKSKRSSFRRVTCFVSKSRNPPSISSEKEARQSPALVKFIHTISDQQLITGTTILVAALHGRCKISLYEVRIVRNLTYFCATTHMLSLEILQDYYRKHTTIRNLRVFFTLVFLVLFGFIFVTSTQYELNDAYETHSPIVFNLGTPFQCVFESLQPRNGTPTFNVLDRLILFIVITKYVSVISNLYSARPAMFNPTPFVGGQHIRVRILRWRFGLEESKCWDITEHARTTFIASVSPRLVDGKIINVWRFFFYAYTRTYLAEIPIWCFQLVYSTNKTIHVVWLSEMRVSEDLKVLGFGQVVAIGLLVLPFLAAVQIFNEEKVAHLSESSSRPLSSSQTKDSTVVETKSNLFNQSNHIQQAMIGRSVVISSVVPGNEHRNTAKNPGAVADAEDHSSNAHPKDYGSDVAEKHLALLSLTACATFTGTLLAAAVTPINIVRATTLGTFIVSYICWYIFSGSPWFIHPDEFRDGERVPRQCQSALQPSPTNQQTPDPTPTNILNASSVVSLITSQESTGSSSHIESALAPASSSGPIRNPAGEVQTTSKRLTESSQSFEVPRRQDTEADIGLFPLLRRRTNNF